MNTKRLATSYVLCAAWFLGVGGVHRLYNGKIVTGLLWLFTLGFFGIGQFVDLFLIPDMVEERDLKLKAKLGLSPNGVPLSGQVTAVVNDPAYNKLMQKILKSARNRGGTISATQAVLDTGANLAEVEAILKQLVKSGHAHIDNHPKTGMVIYRILGI
ncbi:NINE protein [Chroococcidiopsis sp. FACHB-1243]|uniref:NINE protein n=1 Tax=Chroococcidiopsis sp. [FACHB-1243] TaxID=2692781 RepID=UPI00177AEF3E|nr:NINE protein [Chroococcidiopsis sp. [FACHB-1243]]MBD2306391.1 NINE protein [Chroococcidiopsis sp. [FACHB-1243]]